MIIGNTKYYSTWGVAKYDKNGREDVWIYSLMDVDKAEKLLRGKLRTRQ